MNENPFQDFETEATEPAEKVEPPVSLDRLKRMYRQSCDATDENNRLCIRDRDFYDGDQLNAADQGILKSRGQPLFYNNKVAPAISGILGIIDAGESDPEAFPRNSNARQAADVATKLLRFTSDKADFKRLRKHLSENFIIQGSCAAIIECHQNRTGMPEVKLTRIRWEDFFYDHMSKETDFVDARFLGTAKWMDTDQVKALFPEEFEEMGNPFDQGGSVFDSKGDLEARKIWVDDERKRLRVIDMYHLDDTGNWYRSIFCERGFFYFGESEYKDEDGVSICPIEAESYEVKQDSSRYGTIRNMIPLQMEINARRSKLLHLINHRQVQQTDLSAPPTNAAIAKKEAAKADGAIPFGWAAIPTQDMAQGQMLIMNQSMQDLDRLAPTPAVLGRITSSNESGRARQILQQAGYTELSRSLGRFEHLEHRIYRQMWYRIRQFYDAPFEIRVTGQGRAPEFLGINTPIIQPVQQPVIDPQTGQPAIDPNTGQPLTQVVPTQVGSDNSPALMDVDIIISTVPDTVNLEQEVWQQMMEMAGSLGISPLNPAFDMILKLSPLPNMDEKIEQIKAMREEANQANAQAQQMAMAAQMAEQKSNFDLKTAKAQKENALATKTALESHLIQMQHPAMAEPQDQSMIPNQMSGENVPPNFGAPEYGEDQGF